MLDATEQRVVDDVARYGWHLISVEADAEGPAFTYTVGMMLTLEHPEVILFGLRTPTMGQVLNDIGGEIRRGRPFGEPGLYEWIIEGYACKIAAVDPRFHVDYLGFAMWHRRHVGQTGSLVAVQCLWPDKGGRFPDEPGCDSTVVVRQPLLHGRG